MNNSTAAAAGASCPNINVYLCHDKGLLLPLINEYTWAVSARIIVYLLGMLWCFLGIAIIADIFMCSIEKITSKTRRVKVAVPDAPAGFEEIEVKVWNDVVANLTLMALGSSAPEIILSCVDILLNNFEQGELGPSTIVGSAAFNLLVITACCMMAIPAGETRLIAAVKVFAITAFFSVFAYIWLIIILIAITPNYVDLWEAVVTLLMFPVLVILAYIADREFCARKKVDQNSGLELGFANDHSYLPWRHKTYTLAGSDELSGYGTSTHINEKRMRDFIRETAELKKQYPSLTEEQISKLAATRISNEMQHDRLWYRINGTRWLTGGPKLKPRLNDNLEQVYNTMVKEKEPVNEKEVADDLQGVGSTIDLSEGNSRSVVEFTAARSAVLESEQKVKLCVQRYGKVDNRVLFKIETIDGTAEAEKDYIPVKQTMVFEPQELLKFIEIKIIDDNEWEPDEVFFVKLALDPNHESYNVALLGKKAIQEVTIINDDEPGTFEFSKPSFLFKESAGKAQVVVERVNGADGRVSVSWATEDMSAISGKDYEGGNGTLVFEHGETTKTLEIVIIDDQEAEKDECFKISLKDASGGAKLGRVKRTIVTIVNDDDFAGMVSRLVHLTNMNVDALRVDRNTYADQFRNAMNVNGGDIDNASSLDYVMHFLTFGWKLIFAIVPPPQYCEGWLSFFASLIMIGILTTVVGDLASIFGCLIGLKDPVTAITFVALGTSLPDLFASKQAATQEKTADNSIGNVTGSNSVNVFLGLGLPWTIAAIYWTARNGSFHVPAGALGFSVTIYTVTAAVCIGFLVLKRLLPGLGKSELGGPKAAKFGIGIFFILLWVFYILMSSLQVYGNIPVSF